MQGGRENCAGTSRSAVQEHPKRKPGGGEGRPKGERMRPQCLRKKWYLQKRQDKSMKVDGTACPRIRGLDKGKATKAWFTEER